MGYTQTGIIMKSLFDTEECYICKNYPEFRLPYSQLEMHHIFGGTANRKLSEKYGLKVKLCLYHHRIGKYAVHTNKEVMELLHIIGQATFEQEYPELDFRTIFGRNYL